MKTLKLSLVLTLMLTTTQIATPLDDYVNKPDPHFSYTFVKTIEDGGCTAHVLDLVSQSWRSPSEVNRTIWHHWLTIIIPETVETDMGLLYITGGSNDDPAPKSLHPTLAAIARDTKSVVTEIRMVPNQPLVFPGETMKRYEDAIIAYTFDKYIHTGDPTWALLLPMAKSAVRAMDTVQHYVPEATNNKAAVKKFAVAGASKRGWTTWLTAAADKRVAAIMPIVIDVLNMTEQMIHHHAAYGFYSTAIEDYEHMDIFSRLNTPRGRELQKFIDPYNYRDRYAMPKFVLNSSGDQFFLSDSAQFYYHDLPEPKRLRYVPNTDHGLNADAHKSLALFYKAIVEDSPVPDFSWKIEDSRIKVNLGQTAPAQIKLWQATNKKARDFRLETIGKAWKSSTLEKTGNTVTAQVPTPEKGFTAFFVELTYPRGHVFTTQILVTPDTLPFADK